MCNVWVVNGESIATDVGLCIVLRDKQWGTVCSQLKKSSRSIVSTNTLLAIARHLCTWVFCDMNLVLPFKYFSLSFAKIGPTTWSFQSGLSLEREGILVWMVDRGAAIKTSFTGVIFAVEKLSRSTDVARNQTIVWLMMFSGLLVRHCAGAERWSVLKPAGQFTEGQIARTYQLLIAARPSTFCCGSLHCDCCDLPDQ